MRVRMGLHVCATRMHPFSESYDVHVRWAEAGKAPKCTEASQIIVEAQALQVGRGCPCEAKSVSVSAWPRTDGYLYLWIKHAFPTGTGLPV